VERIDVPGAARVSPGGAATKDTPRSAATVQARAMRRAVCFEAEDAGGAIAASDGRAPGGSRREAILAEAPGRSRSDTTLPWGVQPPTGA